MATMSIMGLYLYDSSILDGLRDNLPSESDFDTLATLLLSELAELEILYPDFDICKFIISAWAASCKWSWAKLWDTLNFDYNPIENYDRNEEWTDTNNGSRSTTGTGTSNGVNTVDVSAFNATGYEPRDKTTTTTNSTAAGEETSENTALRSGRAHGNIGVTTTQEMIAAERESVQFNFYSVIIDAFKKRFCILVY